MVCTITVHTSVISDRHPALADAGCFFFYVDTKKDKPAKMCNSTCYVMFNFLWKWRYSGLFGQCARAMQKMKVAGNKVAV